MKWEKVSEVKIGESLIITEELRLAGGNRFFRDVIVEMNAIGGYGKVLDIKHIIIYAEGRK